MLEDNDFRYGTIETYDEQGRQVVKHVSVSRKGHEVTVKVTEEDNISPAIFTAIVLICMIIGTVISAVMTFLHGHAALLYKVCYILFVYLPVPIALAANYFLLAKKDRNARRVQLILSAIVFLAASLQEAYVMNPRNMRDMGLLELLLAVLAPVLLHVVLNCIYLIATSKSERFSENKKAVRASQRISAVSICCFAVLGAVVTDLHHFTYGVPTMGENIAFAVGCGIMSVLAALIVALFLIPTEITVKVIGFFRNRRGK